MKAIIISFGTNPRIVAKFQTDRFRTFDEKRAEKNKEITARKPYASPLQRYATKSIEPFEVGARKALVQVDPQSVKIRAC